MDAKRPCTGSSVEGRLGWDSDQKFFIYQLQMGSIQAGTNQ